MDLRRLVLLVLPLLTSQVAVSLRLLDLLPTANVSHSVNNRTKRSSSQRGMSEAQRIRKLLSNYNRQEPPADDRPTKVELGIYVISVYSISEQTMDYKVSMYLRQQWRDPRLEFKALGKKSVQVKLGAGTWNTIWIPDTFLKNEKGARFHGVTVENRLLKLNAHGVLWYVIKISATLSCPMKLQKFPMDTQICPMSFESFGYTMDTMYFDSLENAVEVADDLQLPQFSLVTHKVIDCSMNYTSGAYPCLEIRFELARDIGYYVIQVYLPTILIVILSWVSFWINVESSPARVTIGLLTVLTTTTTSNGARASLPRVSYIKAIDIWMIVCLTFVFTSLIEYALVNVLARRPARPTAMTNDTDVKCVPSSQRNVEVSSDVAKVTSFWSPAASGTGSSHHRASSSSTLRTTLRLTSSSSTSSAGSTTVGGSTDGVASGRPRASSTPTSAAVADAAPAARDGKYTALRVDAMSRKFFPTAFVVFNVVYWGFFMYTSSYTSLGEDNEDK